MKQRTVIFQMITLILLSGHTYGGTIDVPADYATIQEAVDAAAAGDVVLVAAGTYYGNVLINKPLTLQGLDRNTVIIDGGGNGKVVRCTANQVVLKDLTVRNSGADASADDAGVYLDSVRDCIIESCVIKGNANGVLARSCVYNTIRDCRISQNNTAYYQGAILFHFSSFNTIMGNLIHSNIGPAITLRSISNENTVTENRIHSNSSVGIHVGHSRNSMITRNHVHGNAVGMDFDAASGNIMEDNTVRANSGVGLRFYYASQGNRVIRNVIRENGIGILEDGDDWGGHFVYHNDFVANTIQVQIERTSGTPSFWNDVYPSGGNYWSNYLGSDVYSGTGQNLPEADGIGDTAFSPDAKATDHYPLMAPSKIPTADAGGPYVVPATSWDNALVMLDGLDSSDPQMSALTYQWDLNLDWDSNGDGDPANDTDATSATLLHSFRVGTTRIALVVIDEEGNASLPDVTSVTVGLVEVDIDIVPKTIVLKGKGVVPVVFFTSEDFDASAIDPRTITLYGGDFADGLIRLRRNRRATPMAILVDFDEDGDLDLLAKLSIEALSQYTINGVCRLGALTYDGHVVVGEDTVRTKPLASHTTTEDQDCDNGN